jgi:hypothetical protein
MLTAECRLLASIGAHPRLRVSAPPWCAFGFAFSISAMSRDLGDVGDVGDSSALPFPVIPISKGLSSPHPNDPLRGISSFLRVSAPPWCAFGFAFSISAISSAMSAILRPYPHRSSQDLKDLHETPQSAPSLDLFFSPRLRASVVRVWFCFFDLAGGWF